MNWIFGNYSGLWSLQYSNSQVHSHVSTQKIFKKMAISILNLNLRCKCL